MKNNEHIKAYKKTQLSTSTVVSSHEIVRTLMKELVNSMQKIVLDIQDDRSKKVDKFTIDKAQEEKITQNKSKNLSKSLSIIYGLQTSLDFDKALEIANNLFQLYEYCRQEIRQEGNQWGLRRVCGGLCVTKRTIECRIANFPIHPVAIFVIIYFKTVI